MSAIKLSVVIITFNEERNIGRCLESVKTIADEIVVVDSFSNDMTEEICRSFGAKFITNTFEGHREQKNFALSQAGYDHILSLDADEALSDQLLKSVRQLKNEWKFDSYEISRLTNYCGKWIRHGSWYPDRKIRLMKKATGSWQGQNPHDKYIPVKPDSIGRLNGDLWHYSYYTTEGHVSQVNKFTTIGAKSAFDAGRRSGIITIIFKPCFKFIRDYILKLGFLDGYSGFVIAVISAHASFLKYVKLLDLQKQESKRNKS